MNIEYVLRVYDKFKKYEEGSRPLIETQQIVDVIVSYLKKGYFDKSEEVLVKSLEAELVWTQHSIMEFRRRQNNRWYKRLWRKMCK